VVVTDVELSAIVCPPVNLRPAAFALAPSDAPAG
jgi:hypothetical protein